MISSWGHTLLYLFAVRPTPRLHATSTSWEAPSVLLPSSSGGLTGLACIGAPGARSQPGWSPILSGKGAPYKTPFLDKDDSRRPLVDEFATFLSESSNAFHRKGDKFMAALVERNSTFWELVWKFSQQKKRGATYSGENFADNRQKFVFFLRGNPRMK